MHRIVTFLGLAAATSLVACSSNNNDQGDTGGTTPGTCVMHFTGGPVADPAATCTVEADYFGGGGSLHSVVEIGILVGNLQARFNLTRPGQLDSSTVTNTSTGVTGLLDVDNGDAVYEMTTAPGSETGTFSFHLTKVTVASTNDNDINYSITGTLDASVPADTTTGATGTVTVHATFTGN